MYIEKNVIQKDESWGEYTKIDKDNKSVSKEQREKEKRHWNKKNIEEFLFLLVLVVVAEQ